MCHAKCWLVVTNHFSCRQRAVMVPQHVWSSGLLGTRASSRQCILVVRKKCTDGFILMAVGRWTTRLAWMGAKKRSSDDASAVDRSSIPRPSQCDQSAPTVSMPEANARVSRAPESSRSGVIMSVEEKRKSRKRCRTCTIMSRKSLTSMLQSQHVCSLMTFMDAQQGASEGSCRTRDGGAEWWRMSRQGVVIEMSSRVNISVSASTKVAITRCQAGQRLLGPGAGRPSGIATTARYSSHIRHLGEESVGVGLGEWEGTYTWRKDQVGRLHQRRVQGCSGLGSRARCCG